MKGIRKSWHKRNTGKKRQTKFKRKASFSSRLNLVNWRSENWSVDILSLISLYKRTVYFNFYLVWRTKNTHSVFRFLPMYQSVSILKGRIPVRVCASKERSFLFKFNCTYFSFFKDVLKVTFVRKFLLLTTCWAHTSE